MKLNTPKSDPNRGRELFYDWKMFIITLGLISDKRISVERQRQFMKLSTVKETQI